MSSLSHAASDARHAAAVRRSLRWADEAAAQADWANALGWIEAVQACGDELSDDFRAKRDRWQLALDERRSDRWRADAPGERAPR